MNNLSGWAGRLLIAGLLLAVAGFFGSFLGQWYDRYSRPWAFGDPDSRLAGSWQTTFLDPDDVPKHITINIEQPSATFNWSTFLSRRRKHRRKNPRSFTGTASVTSRRGTEQYELWGSVDRDNASQLVLNTRVVNEKTQLLPNFALGAIRNVRWQGNNLTMTLSFSFRRADGSSFWSSSDPRLNQTRQLTLTH